MTRITRVKCQSFKHHATSCGGYYFFFRTDRHSISPTFPFLLSAQLPWNRSTDCYDGYILCRCTYSKTILNQFCSQLCFSWTYIPPRLVSSLYLARPRVHHITMFANYFLLIVKHSNDRNFVPNFNSCAQQYRAIAILKNHPVTHQKDVLLSAPTRINAPSGDRSSYSLGRFHQVWIRLKFNNLI